MMAAEDIDTLAYPDQVNAQYMESLESESRTVFKLAFTDKVDFSTKAQFSYKGLCLTYRNHGGDKQEIKQNTSVDLTFKHMSFSSGRGQVHIAKGVILGNTMMRFSPALSGQAGIRSPAIKTTAYDQNKYLTSVKVAVGTVDIAMFDYDTSYGVLCNTEYQKTNIGLACYSAGKIITETWAGYKDKKIKAGLNYSMAGLDFNHITADLFYKNREKQFYIAGIYLSGDFYKIRSDSKWGSGLFPGSRGLAGGFVFSRSPWKFSLMAYSITGAQHCEERSMLELNYKKKGLDLNMGFSGKHVRDLSESEIFPFGTEWKREGFQIAKVSLKTKLNKYIEMIFQVQGDVLHTRSYVELLRFTCKKNARMIKIQLTRCCGFESNLYFVRPSGALYYGIRKAPSTESLYLDLIYSKKLETFDVYIHLQKEGVSVGINYK